MTLEKQVSSRGPSKRLCELGVRQGSLFYWIGPCQSHGMIEWAIRDKEKADSWNQNVVYSAFTVAELGEVLPQGYFTVRDDGKSAGTPPLWCCRTWKEGQLKLADTEADARAKMLIYLLEHKLI